MAYEKDPNEIGALWATEYVDKKTGQTRVRLTGTINGQKVKAWPVEKEPGSKRPDYRVKIDTYQATQPAPAYKAPEDVSDDAIPF